MGPGLGPSPSVCVRDWVCVQACGSGYEFLTFCGSWCHFDIMWR
jgi:hypothetical protein